MGIFRKAGVKSRTAKLRTMVESAGAVNGPFAIENMNTVEPNQSSLNFEGAQAHDVADMVKQYFRELPDALLTNKLSETFIAIFQRKLYIFKFIWEFRFIIILVMFFFLENNIILNKRFNNNFTISPLNTCTTF